MIFASWGPPGTPLGALWGRLEVFWGRLGAILGVLGHSWAILEASWALLCTSWGPLGPVELPGRARDAPWEFPEIPGNPRKTGGPGP